MLNRVQRGISENENAPSGEAEEASIETKTSFRKFGQKDY